MVYLPQHIWESAHLQALVGQCHYSHHANERPFNHPRSDKRKNPQCDSLRPPSSSPQQQSSTYSPFDLCTTTTTSTSDLVMARSRSTSQHGGSLRLIPSPVFLLLILIVLLHPFTVHRLVTGLPLMECRFLPPSRRFVSLHYFRPSAPPFCTLPKPPLNIHQRDVFSDFCPWLCEVGKIELAKNSATSSFSLTLPLAIQPVLPL